jgi:uncharacterized protein YegP (UPF0339 family)
MATTKSRDDLVVYPSLGGGFRWRLTAGNGRVIGASTEAYRDRNKCVANAERVTGRAPRIDYSVR